MPKVLVQLPISKEKEAVYAMKGLPSPEFEEVGGVLIGHSEEVRMGYKYYVSNKGTTKYPKTVEVGKVKVDRYILPIYIDMRYLRPYYGTKLSVYDRGDQSVGISGCQYNLEIPECSKDFEKEERERIKEEFSKFVKENFDINYGGASFDDECADCGEKLYGGRCVSKRCFMGTLGEDESDRIEENIKRSSLAC